MYTLFSCMVRDMVKSLCAVEDKMGKEKLYANIMVSATTAHTAVLEQYIDVVMCLISRDFNHKQWPFRKTHLSTQELRCGVQNTTL